MKCDLGDLAISYETLEEAGPSSFEVAQATQRDERDPQTAAKLF